MKERFCISSWALGYFSKPGMGGLQCFELDTETLRYRLGEIQWEDYFSGCVVRSSAGVVYVANELMNACVKGKEIAGGSLAAFSLNRETLSLERFDEVPSMGIFPCSLAFSPCEDRIVVMNHGSNKPICSVNGKAGEWKNELVYDKGSISVYQIREDGTFGECLNVIVNPGDGPLPSQKSSHPHCACLDHEGTAFYLVDAGNDMIYRYLLDDRYGILEDHANAFRAGAGAAPRHIFLHPEKPFLFVVSENCVDGYLSSYSYDSDTGALSFVHAVNLVDESIENYLFDGKPRPKDPAYAVISKDGRFIYASVRGQNTIAVLRVSADGRLSFLQQVSCGGNDPRYLRLTEDEQCLLCACVGSDILTVFRRDAEEGRLTATEITIPCKTPGCVYPLK